MEIKKFFNTQTINQIIYYIYIVLYAPQTVQIAIVGAGKLQRKELIVIL